MLEGMTHGARLGSPAPEEQRDVGHANSARRRSPPMAARAIWKGQLRLSLVSIPVEIYSARNSASRVSFRQIHAPSGKPVRYEKTVPGIGPIEAEDIVKGYDTGEGEYLLLEPDEIDEI